MPRNAISKTTVTQPDEQGTPKKGPGDLKSLCYTRKYIAKHENISQATKNRHFHAQKRDFKNYRNPT